MEQSDGALAELSDIDGKQKKEGMPIAPPTGCSELMLLRVNSYLSWGEPDTGEGCDLGRLRSDSRII